MMSLSSTLTPLVFLVLISLAMSSPNSFIKPFTGKWAALILVAWIRIFPSGVALIVPTISKGMPVPFFSVPVCLISLPCTLSCRFLRGASGSPKTYVFMAWVMLAMLTPTSAESIATI